VHDVVEGAAERAKAREPDVEADVGDAAVGLAEQEHRALDPPPLQVAVGRLPEGRAKGADEVGVRDMRDLGQARDVKRLGVGAVDGVPGPQQAAVQLLDGPGHTSIFAEPLTLAQQSG